MQAGQADLPAQRRVPAHARSPSDSCRRSHDELPGSKGCSGCGSGNEPGIHGDAVAAHTAAGLEHVHTGMVVSQADQLTHVDVEVIAHQRKLIGEGDVHIAEAVLGELYQLSGTGRGGQELALAEAGIEGLAGGGGGWGEAADNAVVADQLLEDAAGEHTLRAVGDVELLAVQATHFSDHPGHLLSGAYRRSGFQQHKIAGANHRRNGTAAAST